jgi:hypothetical protein
MLSTTPGVILTRKINAMSSGTERLRWISAAGRAPGLAQGALKIFVGSLVGPWRRVVPS